jgi:hypothetical protein
MSLAQAACAICSLVLLLAAAGCGNSSTPTPPPVAPKWVVSSTDDVAQPPTGTLTLRGALDQAASGDTINFDSGLNGATIELNIIGENHSILLGETYSGMTFQGYAERDYGKSAIYAKKNIELDATSLSNGITIKWAGGDTNPARVLAVYGDLTLRHVNITGGYSQAEAISNSTAQPYTLARGGGVTVWGTLTLDHSAIYGNKIVGDNESSRDRGTYGGGIYANGLNLTNCIVAGNSAKGYGAAGGGIYSVGGADHSDGAGNDTTISQCVVSGNRVTAQHSYGGGIFTLSGGPTNLARMTVTNSTVARNLAEDNPDLPEIGQYYHRGGGIYMGGGSLAVISSTIAENQVNGPVAIFSGKSNIGGGGVAATIGNAHVVEDVQVQHSIVIGNTMNGAPADWFTGSLINFYSYGYNRIGSIDFNQILVPCPEWYDLSRRHYPEPGDQDALAVADVLDLTNTQHHATILSAGTDSGQPIVLWYSPGTAATNQIPTAQYSVDFISAGYTGWGGSTDDFLNHVLDKLRTDHADVLGNDFGSDLGDLTGTTWYGPAKTWPSDPANAQWIAFWHNLDTEINGRLGTATLGDNFWATYPTGPISDNVSITVKTATSSAKLIGTDQRGNARPKGGLGDVGAIEK